MLCINRRPSTSNFEVAEKGRFLISTLWMTPLISGAIVC